MESKRRNNRVWIVLLVIIGLLGSFVGGGLVGGAVGWTLGARSTERRMRDCWMSPGRPPDVAPQGEPETGPGRDRLLPHWLHNGVVIVRILKDSPAEHAGLQVGEMILRVDGARLDSEDIFIEIMRQRKPGQVIEMTVLSSDPSQGERTVRVQLEGTIEHGRERASLGIEYFFIDID